MFRKKCGKKELAMLKRISRVSQPNIVEFLGTEGDTALLQHALRGDCLKMVGTEEVEWENKKKWCLQVLEALKYLHAEVGLRHRDIRLSNVLLDLKMDAKLCDFGSCQEIGTTAAPITAHSYCPPEGMDREPIVIDRSYDVYSFGMLVHALYTRAEPDADIDSRERLVEALQTKKKNSKKDAPDSGRAAGLHSRVHRDRS